MKNILVVTAVFPPEPVVSANLSFDIADSLAERNSVTVISPRPSRPFGFRFTNERLVFNFNHVQVDSFVHPSSGIFGRLRESYSFGQHCYKYISENHNHIDSIYVNTWPLLGQYFVVKAAKKYSIPIIVHVQDIYPESLTKKIPYAGLFLKGVLMPLDKYILSKATRIIVISKKMKDYLVQSRKLNADGVAVIPNWQNEDLFLNQSKQPVKTSDTLFTFMYLGNIGPVAGVDLLLKAFAKTNLKNARLVIAGSGSMKERLEKDANFFSDSIIEFWPVPNGKVPEVQGMADVLLLPVKKGNASTSIPSKLPAYMFSAKPIIACVDEDSDTAVAINSAKCGYVVGPENIELLVLTMKKAYKMDKTSLEKLGNNGRDFALLNFSKKNNLRKVISLIENLVDGNKKD
ncbi:glycosyltransferase family 4 protein [Ginsengibacter hankyongi]|uniref:Glycosyltransferase family 4 protein n=1 Tax=Ginsengibacter hankyongi TaxID=2607284 RepID=A0A5J5IKB2_9BACT|nr:glycosyltransferase family 4 protein [Ginsengibacter hankyongi]KAA9041460.1 glycosyltransferase family 4 protein [Ginsengibacter hankyongi]